MYPNILKGVAHTTLGLVLTFVTAFTLTTAQAAPVGGFFADQVFFNTDPSPEGPDSNVLGSHHLTSSLYVYRVLSHGQNALDV